MVSKSSNIYFSDGRMLQEQTLWIVPHSVAIQDYPDAIRSAGFNAFLDSDWVKQAVRVSRKFEPISKGSPIHGYRIDVEGLDGNQFELVVTLHWIYASNEPYQQQAQPILIGSHASNGFYPCDLERSRVWGSKSIAGFPKREGLLFTS